MTTRTATGRAPSAADTPMNLEHVRRLRALDFWKGPVTIEPLAGGITNHNYRIRDGDRSFVARLCVPRERLGICRRNEVVCQRQAHALGVAPGVAYHESGVLVSEYVEGRSLTPADVRDPAVVPRLAALLRALHDGRDRITGEVLYFSPFQTVRTYAATAVALGAPTPDDLDALLDDARGLERRVPPFVPALCHNDLLPANVIDGGRRVWLVDWEYAGVGHPLFDLAGVSANGGFTAELDAALMAAYRGTPVADPGDLRVLRILKAVSLLREALWSVIQRAAPEIAFDYGGYAETNFRAYRAARKGVDRGPDVSEV